MAFEPLADRILVKPDPSDEKTPGGIYLPDQSKERPMLGTVVNVGPGTKDKKGERKPVGLNPGDRIAFAKLGGDEYEQDGEKHVVISREAVLGIVRSE
jgi:chaperonin GroES